MDVSGLLYIKCKTLSDNLHRYASTGDNSFYNKANTEGQIFTRVTSKNLQNMERKGPFVAQKLVFENSRDLMNMCYINTMGVIDEVSLESAFARLLITVEQMRSPDR